MPRGIGHTLCGFILLLLPISAQAADIPDSSLSSLKVLVGEWKGIDTDSKPHKVAYALSSGGTSLIDVLDRVLDKGIVIDAWVRVQLVGIDLLTVEARVVVASIDTYLKYSEAVGSVSGAARPAVIEEPEPVPALGARKRAVALDLEPRPVRRRRAARRP